MIASDSFATAAGDLVVQPLHHASLVLCCAGRTIHVDPVGPLARYAGLPPPGLILLTHEHADHCDPATIAQLLAPDTAIIGAATAAARLTGAAAQRAAVIGRGETRDWAGIGITAIAAHNTSPEKLGFHPEGIGNGYVLGIGDRRLYIPGDTEPTADMLALTGIDIAFLPMNSYTMTGHQAAEAARQFRPAVVYPFHYNQAGDEHLAFAAAMRGVPGVEVRLRDWYAIP